MTKTGKNTKYKELKKRNLTPIGRIAFIKSLIISHLNHLFITLRNLEPVIIKELMVAIYFFRFLWNSYVDKVKKKDCYINIFPGRAEHA